MKTTHLPPFFSHAIKRPSLATTTRFCGAAMLLALAGCGAPPEEPLARTEDPLVTTSSICAQRAGATEPVRIALTYDDGPDVHSLDLAKYLHKQGVHATFFVNGRRVGGKQTPDLQTSCAGHEGPYPQDYNDVWNEDYLEMLLDLGHRIANHSLDHCNFAAETNTSLLEQEVRLNQDILDRHIRDGVRTIRFPYGEGEGEPTIAGEVNAAVSASPELYGPVHWDYDTRDWSHSNINPARQDPYESPHDLALALDPDIAAQVSDPRRMIVLHHDRVEFNTGSTYAWDLAKELVPRLQQRGFALTPLEGVVAPGALPPRQNGAPAFAQSRRWSHVTGSTADFQDGAPGHPDWSSSASYYRTIQIADVDGDGDGDACGRWDDGVYCALSSGADLDQLTRVYSGDFTDAAGWAPAQYGTTVQLVDINADGKVDICGRGGGGIACALQQAAGGFGAGIATIVTTAFSDGDPSGAFSASDFYYGSIHFGDVNGDGLVDICGRGYGGIRCTTASKGANGAVTFGAPTAWITTEFSDGNGWGLSQYGSTVQLADVDGDGKADVCGRGGQGIVCALSTGTGFVSPSLWTPGGEFGDGVGWAPEQYHRSIRLADVNGDGRADACGRGVTGVVCTLSKAIAGVATGFTEPAVLMLSDFGDGSFSPARLVADSSTLRFGELNHGPEAGGRRFPDVCVRRGGTGLFCAVSKLDDVSLDYGGAWGYVGGNLVPNPATGAASCPAGYADTKALDTSYVDYPFHVCSRQHLPGAEPLYDFGGMWGYVNAAPAKNPFTNAASCPGGYTDQKVLDTTNVDYPLHVCYKPHVAGTTPEHGFGGLWGYVAGVQTKNPATGAASCPSGTRDTQVLGTYGVDYPVDFCWY